MVKQIKRQQPTTPSSKNTHNLKDMEFFLKKIQSIFLNLEFSRVLYHM